MKLFTHPIRSYCSILSLLFILSFCSKSGNDPRPNGGNANPTTPIASLSIISVSPTSGGFGTTVTITGIGFSPSPINNTITLNNQPVNVIGTSADGTTLTFNVPKGIGTGAISVSVNNTTTTGPIFQYIQTTVVSTLAGNGIKGYADGKGTNAQFDGPQGIAVDASGVVYVADQGNNRLRKIMPDGTVSTLAGDGIRRSLDGKGTNASFSGPDYITFDSQGNGYIIEPNSGYGRVRKFTSDGSVTTVPKIAPFVLAIDANGFFYSANYRSIYRDNPDGTNLLLAGDDKYNRPYAIDGTGSVARFYGISGLALNPGFGTLYVAESYNNLIRAVTLSGVINVTTFAGNPVMDNNGTPIGGFANGVGTQAKFKSPSDVKLGPSGILLYVADKGNHCIRTIDTFTGEVNLLAGIPNKSGFADGDDQTSKFNSPTRIAVDQKGNVYVADTGNNLIRKISFE